MIIAAYFVWYVVACALFLPASLSNSVSDRVLWQVVGLVFGSVSKSSKLFSFAHSRNFTVILISICSSSV